LRKNTDPHDIEKEVRDLLKKEREDISQKEYCDQVERCLEYVLEQEAGESRETFQNGMRMDCDCHGALRNDRKKPGTDTGMVLQDFVDAKEAKEAELSKMEVLSLRLYTTCLFKLVNDPFRNPSADKTHPLPILTAHLLVALANLRAITKIPEGGLKLWRGIDKDVQDKHEFRVRGGTELGCMSATDDREVAERYAKVGEDGNHTSLLFEMEVMEANKPACLSWCSCFADEREYCFPPGTCLRVQGHSKEHSEDLFKIFPVPPNETH